MRLIDADALKYKQQVMYKKDDSDEVWAEWFTTATEIANAPTIDAVPVIRCKDCKGSEAFQNDSSGVTARYCKAFTLKRMVADDDYCSYGERKGDD